MVTEPVDAGLVDVLASQQLAGQIRRAVDVIVAVAVAGAADPAVFNSLRMQLPERVDEATVVSELQVEVVFERGEEAVPRLMVWFEAPVRL
ncbi:MAG: hypothetical protein GEU83_20650 [Pseudonocardiaceae bacterium]|nr:hypothetical protein [Pseudonocardiaceae bacterium]